MVKARPRDCLKPAPKTANLDVEKHVQREICKKLSDIIFATAINVDFEMFSSVIGCLEIVPVLYSLWRYDLGLGSVGKTDVDPKQYG